MINNYEDFKKEELKKFNLQSINFYLPTEDQLVVISDGVLEGELVEGVRYFSPKHMSGWWLTTEKYNGNIDTLHTEHFQHCFEKRPDLIKYLSLPAGFRFFQNGYKKNKEDIWFDSKIVEEK